MTRQIIRLREYVPEGGIIEILATEKTEALREIVGHARKLQVVPDDEAARRLLQMLLKREELGSTGIIPHIAVPHCKSDDIQRDMVILVGWSKAGVSFDAMDGKPVYLLFTVITRKKLSTLHLGALAAISRMISSSGISAMAPETLDEVPLRRIIEACEYEF